MLSQDPTDVSLEFKAATEYRAKHTKKATTIIQRYASNWYRDDMGSSPTPENHVFAYIAFMLTELAYSSPSARVKAAWKAAHGSIARFMEIGLGRWIEQGDIIDPLGLAVRDALISHGIVKIGLEAVSDPWIAPSAQSGGLMPFVAHIPMEDWSCDARCHHWKEARIQFHEYWKDIEDLQSARGADPKVVAKLTSDYEQDPQKAVEQAVRPGKTAERNQVCLIDVWFAESRQIATLVRYGSDANTEYLRPPTAWWGPDSGPFRVLGFYQVPGDPYPMGPLQPVMEQIEELQAHITAAAQEAGTLRSFIGVDASNIEAQKAAKEAKNGEIVAIPGLANKDVQEFTLGGVPPARMEHINVLRERVDRMLAFSDAQRGVAAGKTATESQIVQSNVDVRTEWMRSKCNKFAQGILEDVGWYFFYDSNVSIRVASTDPLTQQSTEGTFYGGTQGGYYNGQMYPPQDDVAWPTDFTVQIETNSMSRTDDQMVQGRALQLIQTTGNLAQLRRQFPEINWTWLVDLLGQSFNQPDLPQILWDERMLAAMMPMLMQAAFLSPQNPQPPPSQSQQSPLSANPDMSPMQMRPPTAGESMNMGSAQDGSGSSLSGTGMASPTKY
jgi:hypothetical protein